MPVRVGSVDDDDEERRRGDGIQQEAEPLLLNDDIWLETNARSFPSVFGNHTSESAQYRTFNRRHTNGLAMLPMKIGALILFVTQFNLEHVFQWPPSSPLLAVCGAGFCVVYLLNIMLFTPYIARLCGLKALADRVEAFTAPLLLEEAILLIGVAAPGGITIARALMGQCPAGTSVWAMQACNPYADVGGRPLDDILLVMLRPVIVQKVFKNVRLPALLVAWAIVAIVVIVNMVLAKAANGYTAYMYLVILFTMSMEAERMQRVHFAHIVWGKRQTQVRRGSSPPTHDAPHRHPLMKKPLVCHLLPALGGTLHPLRGARVVARGNTITTTCRAWAPPRSGDERAADRPAAATAHARRPASAQGRTARDPQRRRQHGTRSFSLRATRVLTSPLTYPPTRLFTRCMR